MDFTLKQGDTRKSLVVELKKNNGPADDITGAVVRFHMRPQYRTTPVLNELARIVTANPPVVAYDFQTGNTDVVGVFLCEFEVTRPDGKPDTYPDDREITIAIRAAIA